ncbi:type II toxin-antitoxin system HipA family toxin [Methylobacterium sp. WL69]|uniref:type II toxin-antitoxin system HipA family toxin n=1 Tax=Methylobacterium sp. WL69 TaxID=2603893 RepID=UPI0011CB95C9|nr:type II toxin-antitoxin system HipA family toxin [Methylobacterium sp. WL69]TXM75265.1 type II toxin-antitoxin system HipA family toxin [Methylobacterium sp. WL69]
MRVARARRISMTSEVYVHVRHRGGATDLAGRYRRVAPAAGQPYGEFAYVGSWLRNDHGRAFALDPEHLPLQPGPFRSTGRGRLPGVLADATPDRWGRRLIAHRRPVDRSPMTAGDWLLATGDERVGCLAFSETPAPPPPHPGYAAMADLDGIADGFERLERGEAVEGLAARLWSAGASMGGARPKAVVEHQGTLWIAKFQRRDDTYDQCGAEHATMRLASRCGIDAAETKLLPVGPRKVILVKRFDRDPVTHEPTAHYLSGLTALGLDETSDSGSYPELALFLLRHGARNVSDRHELFRRMVFNVLCGNRDDHLKNHAVLRRDGAWRLSPAFDVVPQPDMDPQQAIGVGRSGSYPTIGNGLTRAADFDLSQDDARGLVADLAARMRSWRQDFAADGVDAVTIGRLARAFSTELERPG